MTFALLLALQAAAVGHADPVCVRLAPPPASLSAWAKPVEAGATLRPGTAVKLDMADVATLRFTAPPARAPVGGTYGTILPLTVSRAATYRVAFSEAGWLDVVQSGRSLASTGHGHGPTCTGIRKIVEFRLKPGRYTLQIIGAPRPDATLLVAVK